MSLYGIALCLSSCLAASLGLHVCRAEAELAKEKASHAKANQTTADTQKEVSMLTARLAEARQEIDAKQDKLETAERQNVLVSVASAAAATQNEHCFNTHFPAVTAWAFGKQHINMIKVKP